MKLDDLLWISVYAAAQKYRLRIMTVSEHANPVFAVWVFTRDGGEVLFEQPAIRSAPSEDGAVRLNVSDIERLVRKVQGRCRRRRRS
jgi:hypothetical protein